MIGLDSVADSLITLGGNVTCCVLSPSTLVSLSLTGIVSVVDCGTALK